MAAWTLVPCLVSLREEFNQLAPRRDKGSDGTVGDPAHAARTSDHNPDAKGRVLALDIDSTGPWPGRFDDYVQRVVARQKSGEDNRLEYVIWDRRIASRSSGWAWKTYTGTSDPHTGHAHFSARHDHTGQDDVRPWALIEEDDMLKDETVELTDGTCDAIGKPRGTKMSAALLLQYTALHAARASKATDDLDARLAAIERTSRRGSASAGPS